MLAPSAVFRIRLYWSLRGERWSNVVYTALVAGSASRLEAAASAALYSDHQWKFACLALLPSVVKWECNVVDRLTGPEPHRGTFPVNLAGDIVEERPLPPDQVLPFDYCASDDGPTGKGRFNLSCISQQITRGDQVLWLRFPTVQGMADGFAGSFGADGATFRFAVKLTDGNFHLVEFGRFFMSVRSLTRRSRQLCGAVPDARYPSS